MQIPLAGIPSDVPATTFRWKAVVTAALHQNATRQEALGWKSDGRMQDTPLQYFTVKKAYICYKLYRCMSRRRSFCSKIELHLTIYQVLLPDNGKPLRYECVVLGQTFDMILGVHRNYTSNGRPKIWLHGSGRVADQQYKTLSRMARSSRWLFLLIDNMRYLNPDGNLHSSSGEASHSLRYRTTSSSGEVSP